MYAKKLIYVTVALFAAALLWGCGSSGSGGSAVTPRTGPDVLEDETSCFGCHAEGATYYAHNPANPIWIGTDAEKLVGTVDNLYEMFDGHSCQDCHGGGAAHSGTRGSLPHPRPTAAVCAQCHDQVDGILAWESHIFVDVLGNNAPACASCHDPLTLDEDVRLAAQNCMSCHNTTEDLLADPQVIPVVSADDSPISAKVTASMHNFGGGRTGNSCQRCHTVDGFLNLIENQLDPTDQAGYAEFAITAARTLAPTCAACHDPHSGELRAIPGWNPTESAEFNLCTACHNYYDNDGVILDAVSYHDGNWYRNIQSTHYDDPATGYGQTDNIIEGYVIRTNSANPCFDCHGHELRTNSRRHLEDPADGVDRGATIHTDWANSAHGGMLLETKLAEAANGIAAVKAAGREDGDGRGWSWTHYDWDAANRQSCQQCHTATGAANFLDNPAAYDASNNDFSHIVGNQNEMLYCWGCHTSVETGEVRNPGALTLSYTNGAQVAYPDSAASNSCISCHTGRNSGDSVKNFTGNFASIAIPGPHYKTAGAILFAAGGYHFEGRDYALETGDNVHQDLGYGEMIVKDPRFDAVAADYTSGPCATCHFTSSDEFGQDRSHMLSPFSTHPDSDQGIVLNAVCVECHSARGEGDAANTWYGKDFTAADLVAGTNPPHKGRYVAALEVLRELIEDNDIALSGAASRGAQDWTVGGTMNGELVMGATFNYMLMYYDPAGVAHNRHYTRRLLWDSIDYLDDGELNDSVGDTLNALDVNDPRKTGALSYLWNGVERK